MQSQTEELTSYLESLQAKKRTPRSFALYTEYTRSDMAETIRTRRTVYDEASPEKRKELEEGVEAEVENFRKWLEETKKLESKTAYFCAISLKSLLLGLPIGMQMAELFSIPLDNLLNNQTSFIDKGIASLAKNRKNL